MNAVKKCELPWPCIKKAAELICRYKVGYIHFSGICKKKKKVHFRQRTMCIMRQDNKRTTELQY